MQAWRTPLPRGCACGNAVPFSRRCCRPLCISWAKPPDVLALVLPPGDTGLCLWSRSGRNVPGGRHPTSQFGLLSTTISLVCLLWNWRAQWADTANAPCTRCVALHGLTGISVSCFHELAFPHKPPGFHEQCSPDNLNIVKTFPSYRFSRAFRPVNVYSVGL